MPVLGDKEVIKYNPEPHRLYGTMECMYHDDEGIINNQFQDSDRGIVWFPAVINMGPRGIIFPEGNEGDYVWKYASVIEIPKEEQANYNNYSQRLDVDNAQVFNKHDFIGACKAMGITERIK